MSNSINLINQSLSDPQSREKFSAALKSSIRELNLTDNELATTIQVSRPTIQRWAEGFSAPHRIGREPILNYLLHCLRTVGVREIVLEAKSL